MGVIINPGERPWYVSPTGVTFVGKTRTYQTWDDMLKEQYPGKLAWVVDASGDPTVNVGSALYTWREYQGWVKIYETESMDLDINDAINMFVGWVASPEQLNTLYPTGKDGMFAIVGTTDTIWVWDSESKAWVDTGQDQVEINNQWDSIENKPDYFPSTFELVINTENNQTLAQTINNLTLVDTDLTNRLVKVENKLSNLQVSDIQGLQETFGRLKPIAFTASWNDLVDIPGSFAPTAHKHPWSDITNPPDFSRVGHQHVWTDIHEVPNFALANHNHDTVYAPRIHTHTITEIVNLQESLETLWIGVDAKMSKPTSITTGQMIVLGEDGAYIGQDIPGGDVTSEEFNNLINRVTVVESTNKDLEERVVALEEVVFEVDQLADQALDLLGYTGHRG